MDKIDKYLNYNIGKDHYAIDFPDEYPKEYVDIYIDLAYDIERVYKEIKYKFSKLYSIKVNYTNSLKTLTGKYSQIPLSFNIECDGKEYKMVDDWIVLTDSDKFFIYEITLSPNSGKLVLKSNDISKEVKYQLDLNKLAEHFWYIFSEGIIVKEYNTLRETPISLYEMKKINGIFGKVLQDLIYFNGDFEFIFYHGVINWVNNIKNKNWVNMEELKIDNEMELIDSVDSSHEIEYETPYFLDHIYDCEVDYFEHKKKLYYLRGLSREEILKRLNDFIGNYKFGNYVIEGLIKMLISYYDGEEDSELQMILKEKDEYVSGEEYISSVVEYLISNGIIKDETDLDNYDTNALAILDYDIYEITLD